MHRRRGGQIGRLDNLATARRACLVAACIAALASPAAAQTTRGKLLLRIVDSQTRQPVAARMRIQNERGAAVRPPATPTAGDWFYADGQVELELRPGPYQFHLESGPEYKVRSGNFVIERADDDQTELEMVRFADLSKEGWWSGDLAAHHAPDRIELLMRAEDLDVAPLVAWWKQIGGRDQTTPGVGSPLVRHDGGRMYGLLAARDDRDLGGLSMFLLSPPTLDEANDAPFPDSIAGLRQARATGGLHVDVHHAAIPDLPVWVAASMVDSVGLLSDQLQPGGVTSWDAIDGAGQRIPDRVKYPPPQGPARWAEEIYFHLLNCGLRIAPTAGSGAGADAAPLGYNRVYVYCGEELTYERWWEGLRAGKVVTTNGPLITPSVRGEPPGRVFSAQAGQTVELPIGLTLRTREPIAYLEIIQNGRSAALVRLDEYEQTGGRLPPVVFQESGWFLVRAMTDQPLTYRAAVTGPYYVEFDGAPRVSRGSVQFFIDWIDERMANVDDGDPAGRDAALAVYVRAKAYWEALRERANAP
jgi:hypothetical protein